MKAVFGILTKDCRFITNKNKYDPFPQLALS